MIYKLITASSLEEFRKFCDSVMEAGYRPHGSISVCMGPNGNYTRYTQAFTYE
jgi:hypothetical protein